MDPRPDSLGRTDVTRRAFLIGGSATLALAACGRGTRESRASAPPTPLSFFPAFVEMAVGDERLAFAAFRDGKPIPYAADMSGSLVATAPSGKDRDRVDLDTFPIVRSLGGDDAEENSGVDPDLVFVARLPFDAAGPWIVQADLELDGEKERITGPLEVSEASKTVAVGEDAVSVATPTVGDDRGVDPICSRDPVCTMHEMSLDDALRNDKPTVVVFATPAFCTSRMCGPDVDIVEGVYRARKQDANFVHVEIYKDRSLKNPSPGTAAWSIDKAGEPWVFFISSDGVVRDRLSGPIGDFEVEQGVDRLARA